MTEQRCSSFSFLSVTKMLIITKYVVYTDVKGVELTILNLQVQSCNHIELRKDQHASLHAAICTYSYLRLLYEHTAHPKKNKSIPGV